MNFIQSMDWSVLEWIHTYMQCQFLDLIMPKITVLGDMGIIWLVAAVILMFTKKYRRYGIMLFIGIAISFVIGNLFLKPLVARARPCWIDTNIQMLVPIETDFSFPSGHTLASVIGATILTIANRKFAYAAIPLAILIAFSRLYLYLHFLTDVLASIIFGIIISFAVVWALNNTITLIKKFRERNCPIA